MLGIILDNEIEEQTEYEVVEPAGQGGAPPRDSNATSAMGFQPPSRAFRLSALAEREGERMRIRDQLSFERHHVSNSDMDGPLMPPAPESRDFVEDQRRQLADLHRLRQARQRQELRRMARRRPVPTPPYGDGDVQYMVRVGERTADINLPRPYFHSLTPGLSSSRSPSQQTESRARDIAESFLDSDNEPATYAPFSYTDSIDVSIDL